MIRQAAVLAFGLLLAGPAPAETGSADHAGRPDAQDLAVCRDMAQEGGHGVQPSETMGFDIDGDGRDEILGIEVQGTARLDAPYVQRSSQRLSPALARETAVKLHDDQRWTPRTRWLVRNGRAYLIHYRGRGDGYLAYVERVGPDLKSRPLCRFQPETKVAFHAVAEADAALCRSVEQGRVSYAPISRFAEPRAWPAGDFLAAQGIALGELSVDFDNNSRAKTAVLVRGESSAGPGCDLSFYDAANAEDRVRLAGLQHLDFDDAYPRRTCYDAEPRWLEYGGKTYLETQSIAAASPNSEGQEYHWVDALEEGRPGRVCEAQYVHIRPRLTGIWADGWIAP